MYRAMTRSNYFKVNNIDAFRAWTEKHQLRRVHRQARWDDLLWGFVAETDNGSIENTTGLLKELATHLVPGEVAIVQEVGWDSHFYNVAWGWVITDKGVVHEFNLTQLTSDAAWEINNNTTLPYM